jgi:hypothetical protein
MELSSLVFFTMLVVISIGLVAALIYTLRRRILTPLQWGIAFLGAIGWGIGWYIGYFPVWEKWDSFYGYFPDSNPLDLISDIHLSGYYSLAISGILAALLGVGAFYLLLRYFPAQGKR